MYVLCKPLHKFLCTFLGTEVSLSTKEKSAYLYLIFGMVFFSELNHLSSKCH